jgi:hypothetical protein
LSANYRDRIAASKSKLRSTAEPIAAALALAALAGSAQAVTVYSIANPQPYVNGGGLAFNPFAGSYEHDIYDIGANPILAFTCGGLDFEHASNVSFYQGDLSAWPSWVIQYNNQASYSDLVPAGTLLNGSTSFGQTATFGYTDSATSSSSQPNYFAYKIDQGGGTYYGWVEFSMVPNGVGFDAVATRFALGANGEEVTVPGATSPVPEASTSLGLLALGAGGLLTRRRFMLNA